MDVHRNSPQKRTQRIAKLSGALKFVRKFPPGRYLSGVSLSTETALKNVLSRSKNHPGIAQIARKLFPGHKRIATHRNSPQKRAQWVEKPHRYSQIRATKYYLRRNRLLGIKMSRSTEIVPKNVLSPQVHSYSRGSFPWALSPGLVAGPIALNI